MIDKPLPPEILIIATYYEFSEISRPVMVHKSLTKLGYKTKLLVPSFTHGHKKHVDVSEDGVEQIRVIGYSDNFSAKRVLSNLVFSLKVLFHLLIKKSDRAPIFYLAIPPNFQFIFLMPFLRKRRLIVDLVDLWPEAFEKVDNSKSISFQIFGVIEKIARTITLSFADNVVVPNFRFKDVIESQFRPLNGCSVILLRKYRSHIHEKRSFVKPIQFLYIGNLGYIYDFDFLLKVFLEIKKRQSARMLFVGDGPMRLELERKFSGNDVKFCGPVFDELEKMKLFRNCFIGFNGFKADSAIGLPYKFVDYLSMGIPVLNNVSGFCSELVLSGCGVNYSEHSPPEYIADIITNFSVVEWRAMSERSNHLFLEHFDAEGMGVDICRSLRI